MRMLSKLLVMMLVQCRPLLPLIFIVSFAMFPLCSNLHPRSLIFIPSFIYEVCSCNRHQCHHSPPLQQVINNPNPFPLQDNTNRWGKRPQAIPARGIISYRKWLSICIMQGGT
ncbi:hypothetical protein QBC41DRAFT_329943 [Cercophora samala]|uniref:Uncharacterized protein n=1 Tax=Cercophora samala TaxID=330535 RepID=A0AA39Z248_9PEZI|nr:hypothetical protein QBC41DRAFT_329943 [Cercophora samala]